MNNSNNKSDLLKKITPLYMWKPFNRDFSGHQESIKGVIKLIFLNIIMAFRNFNKFTRFEIPTLNKEILIAYHTKPHKDPLRLLKVRLNGDFEIVPSPEVVENKEFSELYFGYLG